MSRKISVLSWIVALLGLWEFGDIAAPFVPGFGAVPAFLWSHIGAGLVLMIAGAWGALTKDVAVALRMGWLAGAVGAWLIVAVFALGGDVKPAGRWNDIVVGALVVGLAAASRLVLRRGG